MVKLFYRLIYILPLSLFCVGIIYSFIFGEPMTGRQFVAAAVFAAFLPILSRLSTQMKIIVLGGTLIVAGAVIFVALKLDKSDGHMSVIRQMVMLLIAVALSAVSFVVVKVRAVRILAAVGLASTLIVSMVLRYVVTRLELWLCIVFIVSVIAEEIQRHYRSGEVFEREKYVSFIWPFVLAVSLMTVAFKAPLKPYNWDLFVRIYERGKEITIELREKIFYSHSEDYDSAMIGFSGDGRIGGDVGAKAEEIMSISTAKRAHQTLYLTGKVFSDFDGREWTSKADYSDRERNLDALIAVCSAQMYGEKNLNDYVRLENMDITFLPFSSRYIFAPSKFVYISMDNENFFPKERSGAIFFDSTRIINTSYRVLYANINYNPIAVEKMTSGVLRPSKENWERTLFAYATTQDPELSYDRMKEYVAYEKSHYSEDVKVSASVADSLEKIKKTGITDYERLKILEATLASMKYTSNPGKLPDKVSDAESYLDYFLTESQEGYCVHYATAFCLMARAMGYPARYVQGYKVGVTQSNDTRVDSSMAHAWPEVWLDGIGWIMFEPTPGVGYDNTGWMTGDEKEAAFSDYMNEERKNPYDIVGKEEFFELEEEEPEPESTKIEWYVFVIPLVSFVIFAVLFMLADSLLLMRKLKKAPDDEKALILCMRNMKMLSYMGFKVGAGETLSEFKSGIRDVEIKYCLDFIPCFERLLYSEKAIDNSSLTTIQISEREIAKLLKERKRMLYLFFRFRSLHVR